MHQNIKSRNLTALTLVACAATSFLGARPAHADNPIVQHKYSADPAPMVHEGTVYLYTSHDEDTTVNNFFTMHDWLVFSSKDMVNWTDHGSPLGYETFSYATGDAWAGQCIHRNGKFYWYVPMRAPGNVIGVAVSDSPTGPFEDALGEPLVEGNGYIDPTVFIDDDGQAYLYWGNPGLHYVRLNEDMISFSGGVVDVPLTTQSFGVRSANDRATSYEEGPWFFKRDSKYFMMFAADGIPEDIAYSTSSSPTGPWTYQGVIMDTQNGAAFTNHAGVIDFQGRSFFFYHDQKLPGGGGFKRSTSIEEFTYNPDGSFPNIDMSDGGVVEAVEPLSPFARVEGETIARGQGIETEDSSEGGRAVSSIEDGDSIKVESVDFRTGALSFEASVASAGSGGNIELHLDAADGTLIGTCAVEPTGGWQMWTNVTCDVSATATDVHDLFLVFTGAGGSLFNLDWWQFTPKDPLPTGSGGADGSGGGSIDGTGGDTAAGGAAVGAGGVATGSGGATGPTGSGGLVASNSGGASAATGGADSGSGGAAPGSEETGCSCTTAPGRGQSGSAWLLLAGLGVLLRSKRKSRSFT